MGLTTSSASQADSAKGEVIFLRGIFGVFSTGLNEMSDNLVGNGISSNVYHHQNWRNAARYLIESKSRGTAGRIVVIGHSFGADAAVTLSKHLNKEGIRIDYLITLDPTVEQTIPGNVRRSVNYYLPQSIFGKEMRSSKPNRGRLANIQLATTDDFGHFTMDNDQQLKEVILSAVNDALEGKKPRLKRHRNTMRQASFSSGSIYEKGLAIQRGALDTILKMRVPGTFLE